MHRALHIAVIADDITGAADTGVQFCPVVGPVLMCGARGAQVTAADHTAGVAVFTDTRHAAAAAAAEVVRLAAEKIAPLKPGVVYKKMDSCLRGNLGAELDALLLATGAAASFVAPALPQQGRTTVDDCHRINGVPVANTEIGRDPRCPVRESRLSVLLSGQSRMPVGRVDLACMEKGRVAMATRVRAMLGGGCRHITFDAEAPRHLDAVAALARDPFDHVILAGSAGLAGSLSQLMAKDLPAPGPPDRPMIRKWLFVCGSASRVLAEQVAMLAGSTGWRRVSIDPAALIDAAGAPRPSPLDVLQADEGSAGGVIVSLQPVLAGGPVIDPDKVVRGLAKTASFLLERTAPEGVFLSGGDTAQAFWREIGAVAVLIGEEILPGLMRGAFVGGPHDGLSVVTKAGAFGHPGTLRQLVAKMK